MLILPDSHPQSAKEDEPTPSVVVPACAKKGEEKKCPSNLPSAKGRKTATLGFQPHSQNYEYPNNVDIFQKVVDPDR